MYNLSQRYRTSDFT